MPLSSAPQALSEPDVFPGVQPHAETAALRECGNPLVAPRGGLDAQQQALLELGVWLKASRYLFTTVTPATHERVNSRGGNVDARTLRDVFGWSRPFSASLLPASVVAVMRRAGVLEISDAGYRSTVRFSSLGDYLLVHSAHPTVDQDAVFFGPDSYRYAHLIEHALRERRAAIHSIADIGCGTGIGGLLAAGLLAPHQPRLLLTDISPMALKYAAVNAQLAGQPQAECCYSDLLGSVRVPLDLILCNPPYMIDAAARLYRNGGGSFGCDLAARLVAESLAALAPGGQLVLYSGAPMVNGVDMLRQQIEPLLAAANLDYDYCELDPDVFGEELQRPAYCKVERIAAVGLVARMH